MVEALTCDYDQHCEAREGGNVQLHAMKGLRKLHDGVDPVPKASDTLRFVKHCAVAEDQLVCFRIGTWTEKKQHSLLFSQTCNLYERRDQIQLSNLLLSNQSFHQAAQFGSFRYVLIVKRLKWHQHNQSTPLH